MEERGCDQGEFLYNYLRPVRRNRSLCSEIGEIALSGLDRIREAARRSKNTRFTSLMHHVTIKLLRNSFYSLKRKAAAGVDEISWVDYGEGLEERLVDLHERVQSGRYRAQPSKRVWIPKADGRERPIGIATTEDKIVQHAVVEVLNQIYEEEFMDFSYGFRPGRSQHNALDVLWMSLMRKKMNYVLDTDIKGFFDAIDHDWMMKFLEHRIVDPRILRLVRKWLRAGVSEDGEWSKTKVGTPQGAVISPLLGNIYLHYAFDLWANQWCKYHAKGHISVVRFADDIVICFQYDWEAKQFRRELEERLAKFGLTLHPDKTRLIEFGRFAAENRKRRGDGKPETFSFLGFTHMCDKTKKNGSFIVKRKTIVKRMRGKLKSVRVDLMKKRHDPVPDTGKWLRSVIKGHLNYYGVPGNELMIKAFRRECVRGWFKALRRRSQKARKLTWERMERLIKTWIPAAVPCHPYPSKRFAYDLR